MSAGLILQAGQAGATPGDAGEGANAFRVVMDTYATCLVRSAGTALRGIVAGDPNSGALERWRTKLNGECMVHTDSVYYVNPPSTALRMTIADVLVRQLKRRADPAQIVQVPPLIHPDRAAAAKNRKKGATFDSRFAWLSPVGECVVRADPVAAAALLASDVESRDELTKVKALSGALGTCARTHGGARMSILELRGTVALNYYRLSSGIRTAAGGAS